jgi:uncharacterized protein (TIGR00730 family)
MNAVSESSPKSELDRVEARPAAQPQPFRSLCVFGGSREGVLPAYLEAAKALGSELARRRIGLVYGGGQVGLMGGMAGQALVDGGEVVGVMPHALTEVEILHEGLTHVHMVDTMHARKAKMEQLSEGFIALPGGFGTFEELFEIITWSQLGIHRKPIGLLDVDGYFAPLRALVEHGIECGFIPETQRSLLHVATSPSELLEAMAAYRPAGPVRKWMDHSEM